MGNRCVLRKNKLDKLINKRQGPKISRRIVVTRGPSRSKNQVTFGRITLTVVQIVSALGLPCPKE